MLKPEKHQDKIEKLYMRGVCWGAWDGLHIGHFNLLRNASELCNELYVGVSSDEYIKKVKKHEPMFFYLDRRMHLEEHAKLYYKRAFKQDLKKYTKEWAIREFHPDVIFVGDDWEKKKWDGAKLGVEVIYLPYTRGISSTILRKRKK